MSPPTHKATPREPPKSVELSVRVLHSGSKCQKKRQKISFFLPTLLNLFKFIDEVVGSECFSLSSSNLSGSFFVRRKVPNWKLWILRQKQMSNNRQKMSFLKVISWVFPCKFLQIHMISVSCDWSHFIYKNLSNWSVFFYEFFGIQFLAGFWN